MKRVIIESPYAGNVPDNLAYARACMADSLDRGEAPIAFHLLYTQVLDDGVPAARLQGLRSGFNWYGKADLIAVYTDLGISEGMRMGIEQAAYLGIPVEQRKLPHSVRGWVCRARAPFAL